MPRLLADLRFAARGLLKTPTFTIGVVLTLALGIGINATMFGVVDTLFLRTPAGVARPDGVVRLYFRQDFGGAFGAFTSSAIAFPAYEDMRDHVQSFDQVAAITTQQMGLGRGNDAVKVNGSAVSYQYFPMLGLKPSLGRFFTAEEDRTGGDRVVVLTYGFWKRQFNSDPAILGRAIAIGKGTYTVIGVGPERFSGLDNSAVDLFLPIHPAAEGDVNTPEAIGSRNYIWLTAIAHLKPGAPAVTAAAEATLAFRQGNSARQKDTTSVALLGPIQESRAPESSSEATVGLWIGIVAAIVLLIACANVANLLLARANARRRELAVRASLGAGRGGLVRALLAESLVLAGLGGAGAVALATWTGAAARHFLLPKLSPDVPIVEGRMLAFTCAIVLLTTLLTGLVPAWQASRTDLTGALKLGGHGATARGGATRMVLLTAQIALTLALLVGAGLFVSSLRKVQGINVGFDTDRVYTVAINLSGAGMARADANDVYLRLRDDIKRIPAVESAAATMGAPFRFGWSSTVRAQDADSIPQVKGGGPYFQAVTPEYFATMGTRVLRGRDFNDGDRAGSQRVALVGSTFARLTWPNKDPIGKCLYMGEDSSTPCTTVIGVVADAKRGRVTEREALLYYIPFTQYDKPTVNALFVRARPGQQHMVADLQRLVRSYGTLPYATVESLADEVVPQMRSWQLGATAFTAFGLLALVIAATGVFSVLSYSVSQRTKEIGVRVALGAQSSDVVRLIVGQGLRAALLGTLAGLAMALVLGRAIASLLYEVAPTDARVFAAAAGTLLVVAALAAFLPARRASRLAPMIALRSE